MKVLFDTNVILDTVLARVPFIENAAYLFEAVELGKIQGFISAMTVTDIHYLVKRHTKSAEIAIATISKLLILMEVCAVARGVIQQAVDLGLSDFEDAVQVAAAMRAGLNAIITRDVAGFVGSPVPIMSPDEMVKQLS
ncbi:MULTISPECIES: PIN domain-containing protein [Pseudanabaena]|jgi:predicted nucleic acid-binding protein|uniref:PIN domain-containing protein n=1 Tax=Pseudanabaena TaxID=1152 RepID=UPI00247869B2|nr:MULTISPECIES: PIN domain-containing protein [Pseudanabaena]MEA5488747.1 PIN domain-containing protein [Pseudanabaena sp. CCNP1317]WGS71182.1 PIN domain-containing protein [Pseudanabaena galeata CCNP1313]